MSIVRLELRFKDQRNKINRRLANGGGGWADCWQPETEWPTSGLSSRQRMNGLAAGQIVRIN